MGYSGTIEHVGVISKIGEREIMVNVNPESACGNCRANSSCSIGATGEKTINVVRMPGDNYSAGEKIMVVLEQSLGLKALGLGYLLPFMIVLALLIIFTALGLKEFIAGILSLASLIPYYAGLFLLREKLKKEFSFRLQKM